MDFEKCARPGLAELLNIRHRTGIIREKYRNAKSMEIIPAKNAKGKKLTEEFLSSLDESDN